MLRITALNIHPIKSCRGVPVESAEVDRYGLVGDRRLMLVDESGRFMSQRELPSLATLSARLDGVTVSVMSTSGEILRADIDAAGPLRPVSVWGNDGILANDQGDEMAAWFSSRLEHSVRLVAFGPASRNPIDPAYSPRADAETAFTDGYPIMATLEESLADLNSRLARPVPMGRFRPTVVVAGGEAWSDDQWRAIRLGDIECDAVKPCARCVITTTDQRTGARDATQEPLRTLASFRTRPGLGALFGQNIVPRTTGWLRVGDPVELL